MKQIRFTKEGYDKLKNEYQELLVQRPAAVEDLKKARELGDLSENGY
ncbi:transcription elongation factor GreA, partial [Patescibacteria group bacterium]|nr:transcription elongation factor GreA [Patescibacteria group bacterium]